MGPTAHPGPGRDAQPHRAQGSPPELAAGTRGPNASPAPESPQTGEKVAGAASRSREPEAAVPQLRNGPPRPTRPPRTLPAPRPRAPRADPRAHRGRGRALTWHPPSNVQVLAVFKQVSGRKKEEKNPIMQMAPDREARAGAEAATARVREQPGRQIYGARHGYARSRRRASRSSLKR